MRHGAIIYHLFVFGRGRAWKHTSKIQRRHIRRDVFPSPFLLPFPFPLPFLFEDGGGDGKYSSTRIIKRSVNSAFFVNGGWCQRFYVKFFQQLSRLFEIERTSHKPRWSFLAQTPSIISRERQPHLWTRRGCNVYYY